MALEAAACGLAVAVHVLPQRWEERKEFFAGRVADGCQTNITRVEALCCRTFCVDHFVLVKHHVDVSHVAASLLGHVFVVDHVLGRYQDFAFAEQELCAVALEQHAVLW